MTVYLTNRHKCFENSTIVETGLSVIVMKKHYKKIEPILKYNIGITSNLIAVYFDTIGMKN